MIEQFAVELNALINHAIQTLPRLYLAQTMILVMIGIFALSIKLNMGPEIVAWNIGRVGVYFSKKTFRTYGGLLSRRIERHLINLQRFKLELPLMPMMIGASPQGYAPVIRSFKQFGSTKEGDADGDGENDADKEERNQNRQPVQKSSWERVLEKFVELSARLDLLEAT